MPTRPRPARRSVLTLAAVALAATVLVVAARGLAPGPASPQAAAEAWEGLVGDPSVEVATGQRMIVVLDAPSLADRVRGSGGLATEREERRWSAAATSLQQLFVSRMTVRGAQIRPEYSFTRVLNGFSAALDPRTVALLERAPEVEGIYPVRAAFPASVSTRVLNDGAAGRLTVGLPGFDGRGVTVALLDTGVDRAHPYLGGRLLEGIDVLGEPNPELASSNALAAPHPGNPSEVERHGTQMAGIVAGGGGPGGISGVATGATILPIRVAGWQRDARGEWAVYGRTDQIVAGLERAVDPNGDGDAHDAARVALVGVAERFAAFADGPLARAAAGALALDTLVVAPAGNDGPKGPGFGSVAGPGGAPAVLTVGAADQRPRHERARVVVRVGLNVVVDGLLPLAGLAAPPEPVRARAATPRLFAPDAPAAEQAAALELSDFFDRGGFSLVAGRAAIVPGGGETRRVVEEAARAGAVAVLVYGDPVPAGALGLDERIPVPVVGIPEPAARAILGALARGSDTGVSIGAAATAPNRERGSVASFSSRGLAFDGRLKPELTAPGVGVPTSEPGSNPDGSPSFGTLNGSSAAAAVAAGAAAVLAHARPDLGAAALKSLLVASARPLADAPVVAQGAGLLDLGAAAASEVVPTPSALAFGRATTDGWSRTLRVRLRNASPRPVVLRLGIERRGFPAADAFLRVQPGRLTLGPGRSATVQVTARVPSPAPGGPPAEGALVVRPVAGAAARVPFAIAFARDEANLLGEVSLSAREFEPSDTQPAVLSIRAGLVRTVAGADQIEPVGRLDVELRTGDGRRIGTLARLRNLLPTRLAFGITGRDPAGQLLDPGAYRLRVVAYPTTEGKPSVKTLQFRVK